MTPKDVIKMAQENKAVMVDFKFLDFPGIWQHFAAPVCELKEEIFEEGLGFDGSSIRGWQAIHCSDGPLYTAPHAEPYLQHCRPYHKRIIHKGPPVHCAESRGLSQVDRDR